MKKLLLITAFILFIFFEAIAQLNMSCGGNVSVGNTTPDSYTFKVEGTSKITAGSSGSVIFDNSGYSSYPAVYGGANLGKSGYSWYAVYSTYVYQTSDVRQKENIRGLNDALGLILQLNGIKFDYIRESVAFNFLKNDGANAEKIETARKGHVGFIAQDVMKVIPEIVSYDDSADIYSIDLTKLTPYLVEAIKEQDAVIKDLKAEIENIKTQLNNSSLLKSSSITSPDDNLQEASVNELFQNSPNPFNESTRINYYLTKETQNASLNIYDLNGKQLKSIQLYEKGNGDITINGGEYKAGMYMYALIADGNVIDTKRMILTD